jgi:hypothetical protein
MRRRLRPRTRQSSSRSASPAASPAATLLSDGEDDDREEKREKETESEEEIEEKEEEEEEEEISLWKCFMGELTLSERAAEERRMERLVDNMPGFVRVLVYVEKVREIERETENEESLFSLSISLSLTHTHTMSYIRTLCLSNMGAVCSVKGRVEREGERARTECREREGKLH